MTDYNMRNILKKFNSIGNKKLNESAIAECGMDMPPAQAAPKTPMSVNISGDAGDIANMLKMLSGIESNGPRPMAMSPMDNPAIPGRDDVPGDQDLDAGVMGGLAGAALGAKVGGIPGAIAGGYLGHKTQQAADKDKEEEDLDYKASTAPSEKYASHDMMTNKLSGGINDKKKMFKPAAKGDNPMSVESIKDRLYAALTEKKAKPDYLDMDKDGNKKEPMKKAIADKKGAAPKKGQVPPQFAKKKAVKEAEIAEISSDLAKRYTKASKMDREFNDKDIDRLSKSGQSTQDMHKRNSKRTKGINRAKKSM